MHKPTILIITDWYEPGYKAGGPIQSCRNIVKTFQGQYEFYVLTSDRDLRDTKAYEGIVADAWTNTAAGTKVFYASPGYLTKQHFIDIMRQVQPGVVYFNSMFSPGFTLKPLWWLMSEKYQGKIVLAPRGMLQAGALQKKTFKKKFALALLRTFGWSKRIIFHATDEQEKNDITHFFPNNAGVVLARNIPNINTARWQQRPKLPGTLNCIFISRIHPKKNLELALQAMKQVAGQCKLSFDIYGEEDDAGYSMDCRKMAETAGVNASISFRGPLPHAEVFATLSRYHLFVLPTLGENFGHSIFEALSAGVPVLISDKTPWRNLQEHAAGYDLPLRDASLFAGKLQAFCDMDQHEYNKWSMNAYKFAEQYAAGKDVHAGYSLLFTENIKG